jgi:hypothetical protein
MISFYITNASIDAYLLGLQTKGKFSCLVCGPRMRSHRSRSLGKEVFDEYRQCLLKNHRYRNTDKHLLNGKGESGIKPRRTTPHLWKLEYNRSNRQCKSIFIIVCNILHFLIVLNSHVYCV